MPTPYVRLAALALCLSFTAGAAHAGGGPFGIDHRIDTDDRGPWRNSRQRFGEGSVILTTVALALWEGDGTPLGHSAWQSVDALAIGAVAAEGLKIAFSRARPNESDDPNDFFEGHGHRSFPSGQVTLITSAVTPFVLAFADEHPAVYALELLPLYAAVARVKSGEHWQSDVIVGFALGTAVGYYAHDRASSLAVGLLPGGMTIGWRTRF